MEWIKCSDRMPDAKSNQDYLVYGYPTCGSHCQDWQILFCKYKIDENHSGFEFGEYDCSCYASHWMPLPPPPEE